MRFRTADGPLLDFSFKLHAGFYQHLLNGVANFQALGEKLVRATEQAKTFRRFETVAELAQVLTSLPLEEYKVIGQYYLGWREVMRGGNARSLLERCAEYGPYKYRALAMDSLSAIAEYKSDYPTALRWLIESVKLVPSAETLRGMAVVKAKEGDHQGSLKDLENLLPLARYSDTLTYFHCLNSLAVEFGEVGRVEEARNICKVVLASPYASAYPEWQATAEDLRGASRSFVTIKSPPHVAPNILFMPSPEQQTGETSVELKKLDRPARVFNLHQWKTKLVKEPNANEKDGSSAAEVSDRQMLLRIVELASTDDLSDETLRQMVKALEKIVETYKRKES